MTFTASCSVNLVENLGLTSTSIISYTNSTKDFMVPSIWGGIPKGEDPYVVQASGGKSKPVGSLDGPRNLLIRMRFRLLHCNVKNRQNRQERYDMQNQRRAFTGVFGLVSAIIPLTSVHISGWGGVLPLGGWGEACNVCGSNFSMCIVTDSRGRFQARAFKN